MSENFEKLTESNPGHKGAGKDFFIDALQDLYCAEKHQGGQAPAHKHIDKLLAYVKEGKVRLDDIITHRLPLTQIADGYAMFKKKEDNCVKVVLDPWAA